jgi:heme exporter protein CcmD
VLALFDRCGSGALALHHSGEGAKRLEIRGGNCLVMNWSQFFSMGGYALYVWGSYIFALVAIGGEVLSLRRRKKSIQQNNSAPAFKRE